MIYPLFLIEALKEGFIGILLTLDTIIYSLISSSFKVFMAIAGARLLSSDAYFEIANKVYILVGVLMLFVLSYAILKGIVDPDGASKGDFGPKMIKNVVIAVIGLAVSPVIFNFMYQAQGLILEQDVLGKIFFRIENTDNVNTSGTVEVGDDSVSVSTAVNPDEYVKTIGGAVTAVNLWQAFFSPSEDSGKDASEITASAGDYFISAAGYGALCAGLGVTAAVSAAIPVIGWAVSALAAGAAVLSCTASILDVGNGISTAGQIDGDITLQEAYAMASAGEGFGIFTVFLNNYVEDGEITYLFGISTIAGLFALYAFVSFSIDMGVRAAKLAYLQIIAPIPLVMQVLPKYKKSFDNYIGMVASTFMEVFIRISVVYVVVYIICHLTEMFSSASLWGNDELNVAEKLFALAFLILGLIAFCRKAPEFITNSLGLKKGDMHLGIGKKLADGGFYAGKSVIGGGITAGVRNWRNAREGMSTQQKALSALAGFGSGAARAAALNFGPGHKPADTWRQSRDIAENAAQAANDARDKRDGREKRHEDAIETLRKARESQRNALSDFTAKEQALLAARANGDQTAIAAAQAEYDAAEAALKSADEAVVKATQEARATTAVGDALNTAGKRIDSWSIGTVSTAKEEAAIRFGDSLDALKGKLREEAYKKDNAGPNGAGTLKQEYERLKAQPIREYKEGWDEQSYNAEYRRRLQELNKIKNDTDIQSSATTLTAARTRHAAALAALDNLKNSGVAPTDQSFINAQNTLHAEEAALASAESSFKTLVQVKGGIAAGLSDSGDIVLDMSDIKLDERTARAERARQVEGLRIAMEAAADEWVHKKAQEVGSNTNRDIQLFISENAAYINEHATDQIVVGYDANDNPIKETINDVITRGFGSKAVTEGKFELSPEEKAKFKASSSFEIEVAGKGKIMYKIDGDSYIPVDATGKRINDPDLPEYHKDNIFESIREGITRGKIKGASSKSAISQAADAGKQAATYTKTHEMAEKKLKQRQAQENKGGKK